MSIKLTQLYESYVRDQRVQIPPQNTSPWLWPAALGVAAASVGALVGAASAGLTNFDELFPAEPATKIIASGGDGSAIETPAELGEAAGSGADGAVVAIRSTKDGQLVAGSLAGDDGTGGGENLEGLTLAEATSLAGSENLSAFGQMLASAREAGLTLFVDLKDSAPASQRQTARLAVEQAREAGMLSRCVFVSDSSEVISFLAEEEPEAATGYSTYAAYGDIASLQADYLILDELAATADTLLSIQALDKKAAVRTVDAPRSMQRILTSGAAALLTGDVRGSAELRRHLASRTKLERVLDRALIFF